MAVIDSIVFVGSEHNAEEGDENRLSIRDDSLYAHIAMLGVTFSLGISLHPLERIRYIHLSFDLA